MVVKAKSKLEAALEGADRVRPDNLPRALPVGHTGKATDLVAILSDGLLEPRYCQVMRKRLLYLFYGGLFYRSEVRPTQEETAYPIGFLFHPKILDKSDVYYPFDSGAMAHGHYGQCPPELRTYKTSLRVSFAGLAAAKEASHCPRLLVKHLFKTNRAYLSGKPDVRAVNKPDPIPSLFRFFVDDKGESDHRRACIEAQRGAALALADELLWLGYPDIFEDYVQDFFRRIDPHVPKTWRYPSYTRFRPSDVCAKLEGRAWEVLEPYVDEKAIAGLSC